MAIWSAGDLSPLSGTGALATAGIGRFRFGGDLTTQKMLRTAVDKSTWPQSGDESPHSMQESALECGDLSPLSCTGALATAESGRFLFGGDLNHTEDAPHRSGQVHLAAKR